MAAKSKASLFTELPLKVITGGRETTAQFVRDLLTDTFDSYPNIVDGGNVFQVETGYISNLTLSDPLSFTHKQYVDDQIAEFVAAEHYQTVQLPGLPLPQRAALEFGSNFSLSDDPAFTRVDLDLAALGASFVPIGGTNALYPVTGSIEYNPASNNTSLITSTSIHSWAMGDGDDLDLITTATKAAYIVFNGNVGTPSLNLYAKSSGVTSHLSLTTGWVKVYGSNTTGDLSGLDGNDLRIFTEGNGDVGKGLYLKAHRDASGGGSDWPTSLKIVNAAPGGAYPILALQPEGGDVSIFTSTPTAKLHITGDGTTSSTYSQKIDAYDGSKNFYARDDGQLTGRGNMWQVTGNGAMTISGAFPVYGGFGGSFEADYIGVNAGMQVNGAINFSSGFAQIYGYGGNGIKYDAIGYHAFVSSNVGIYTSTPTQALHVVGSIRMVDGNEGTGKILTSDNNGVGIWATAPFASSTLNDGKIFIGNVSNIATAVTPSGEWTITNTGVSTLSNAAVIGKFITGVSITGGSISGSDTILQAFGKLQNQINSVLGGAIYEGTWNANTNSPTLTSSSGTKGYYYVVSVSGATNLDGIIDWKVGDWAIYNGTTWDKVDNTDAVSSVNGLVGAIALTGTSNRITISGANVFDIAATYVGQTSITTLGTVTTGVWNGTAIANANLANSTISGVALGSNLFALTIGTGLSGTTYNGSTGITIAIDATVATLTGAQALSNKTGNISQWTNDSGYALLASPTFTGHITVEGVTATGATGTGKFVFDNSPTLITPTLGAAIATTINKVTITQPVTSATLTLVTGSSLITAGAFALTLTTTNTTNVTLPTSGTLATLAGSESFTNKTITSSTNTLGGVTMGLGSDAVGDMYYGGTSNVLTRLAAGAAGKFLMYNGVGAAPIVSTLVMPNAVALGNLLYATSANTIGSAARWNFDASNIFNFNATVDTTATMIAFNGASGNSKGLIRIYNPALGVGIGYFSGNNSPVYIGSDSTCWATFKGAQLYIGGATAPTAALHLPASTAAANTSQIKYTVGVDLTAGEDGASWYNGTDYIYCYSTVKHKMATDINTLTLTNKTLGNTNTITLKDTLFTLQDDGDTTKQAQFQLSGITTGTTRTYTLPNIACTLLGFNSSSQDGAGNIPYIDATGTGSGNPRVTSNYYFTYTSLYVDMEATSSGGATGLKMRDNSGSVRGTISSFGSATGNYTGTTISSNSALDILAAATIAVRYTTQYNIPGTTASNIGFRSDSTGFVIGRIDGLQTAGTYAFDVRNGDIGIATVGNALRIKTGTGGMAGQIALVAGVATITITGLTTGDFGFAEVATLTGRITGVGYKVTCTANTLTITSVTAAGVTDTSDVSTVNYFIVRPF